MVGACVSFANKNYTFHVLYVMSHILHPHLIFKNIFLEPNLFENVFVFWRAPAGVYMFWPHERQLVFLPSDCFRRELKPSTFKINRLLLTKPKSKSFWLQKIKRCIRCEQKTFFLCHLLPFEESQNNCHPTKILNSWRQSTKKTAFVLIKK